MLVAVPDQRPVVTSIVCPLHVCVLVRTFVAVVAVNVALTATTSPVFQWAKPALVATRAPSAAVISTNRFMRCRLLLGIS